ncbi:MAG: PAS domain S-box protein [Syntrophobacteraceae bacterium]
MDRLRQANELLSREAEVNSTIAHLSRQLMALKSLDEMALLTLESAKRFTDSHLGYICYVDCKTGTLRSPAVARKDIEFYGGDDLRNAFEELASWAQRHGESLLANGFEDPELLGISFDGYSPLDRILSVPAIANGNVLGQIVLANSARDYTEQDADRLQSLATMYALATQHLQAAINLRRANEYLENIFANSPDAIGIVDKSGKFLKWNRMAAELYGYTMEELRDKKAFDLYADQSEVEKIMAMLRSEGAVRRYETNMKRKDGTVEAFEISIGLLADPVAGSLGSVCIARDLSPLKKVIEELRGTHREMSQLVASIPSFLIELDQDGRITRWNNSAARIFGIAGEKMLGLSIDDCPVNWDRQK